MLFFKDINNFIKTLQVFDKKAFLLLFSAFIFSNNVFAKNKEYMVEVLVFENKLESIATESYNYVPPRESKSDSETWLLEPSMLLEEAEKLINSEQYQLIHHFSWGQESLPYEKSANYHVIERAMQGWIKIYAEQLLFANIDVDYNGYRLVEKRRLKLNEKHYFDHPKFGLLIQVSRLEKQSDKESQ